MLLERRDPRLDHDEVLEVEHPLEIAERHVEDDADPRRHRLQQPDMGDRRSQLDMAHALAPNLALDHLDAAFLADDAAILHPLVLAAQAFVVLDRAEDAGTEQAVALGLERPIVDRFRLLDLAVRPSAYLLRAGDRNSDLIELERAAGLPEEVHQLVHGLLPLDQPNDRAALLTAVDVMVSRRPRPAGARHSSSRLEALSPAH